VTKENVLYYWPDNFSRTYMHMYAHYCDAWRQGAWFMVTPTHTRKQSTWHRSNRDVNRYEMFVSISKLSTVYGWIY